MKWNERLMIGCAIVYFVGTIALLGILGSLYISQPTQDNIVMESLSE